MVARLALYALVMVAIRCYVHNVGIVGALFPIIGMCDAARWAPNVHKERTDNRLR